MKRSLLLFMIIFMGFSLSLSAKQKFICHMRKAPAQIPYKLDALNGAYVIYPIDKIKSNSNTCPNSITVKDKYSEDKIHTLKLLTSNNGYCYYSESSGGDSTDVSTNADNIMCIFTYVQK